MKLSELIILIRKKMLMDKKEFSTLLGLSGSAVANYEKGYRVPRFKTIRKIIELAKQHNIEVDIDNLF